MFASDLIRALDATGIEQRVAVLHGPPPFAAPFAAPSTALLAGARPLLGVRIDRGAVRRLRGLIEDQRPHVIHAHGNEPFKTAVFAARWKRIPIVYRRIGVAFPSVTKGLRRVFHGTLMLRSRRIVTVADAVRKETIEIFRVPNTRVVTVPRGVDPVRLEAIRGRAELRDELAIPQDAPVLLSLGALSEEKNPLGHVEAFERVRVRVPRAVHIIAGDGPLRADVEREVRERGLEEHVRLVGNRPDVGDVLAASDVMILASWMEGMPGCLIEAGMAGLPSVATDVAGVREVIEDGTTGFLVSPGDLEHLARRAADLLTDPELYRATSDAARERCLSRFSIDAIAPRYLEIYRDVAAGREQR
jgi:glycosyltransferase involved in cell wall biosynthesis